MGQHPRVPGSGLDFRFRSWDPPQNLGAMFRRNNDKNNSNHLVGGNFCLKPVGGGRNFSPGKLGHPADCPAFFGQVGGPGQNPVGWIAWTAPVIFIVKTAAVSGPTGSNGLFVPFAGQGGSGNGATAHFWHSWTHLGPSWTGRVDPTRGSWPWGIWKLEFQGMEQVKARGWTHSLVILLKNKCNSFAKGNRGKG